MNRKLKLVLSGLISRAPTSQLRVALYNSLLGYKISKTHIGFGTVIAVDQATITGSRIGPNNTFTGPMRLEIANGSNIGTRNRFECGWWTATQEFAESKFDRRLVLQEGVLITTDHHFDVAGQLSVGKKSWIAGAGSQFWTHGVGVTDRNISIGDDCYIGSAVRFAPGTCLGNNVIVSLGSVVTKKISDSNALIAGVPAQVVRSDYDWKAKDAHQNR